MNRIVLTTIGFFLFSAIAFSQSPTNVASDIQSVTVYPQGAQVTRKASKAVTSGRQMIVFTGLASELDPASINVSANGDISILSVSSQVNYLKQSAKPKAVIMLEDSLKSAEFDFKFNQNMLNVYAEEKAMILSNKSVGWGGQGSDFLIEDLEDLSDFYRDRLSDIMLKVMQLEQKQKRLNEKISRMRAQLNEHNSKLNRSTGEILVEAYAPKSMTGNFELSYMVRNAGWVPAYNVNVTEVDEPLNVSYNAKVYQNTGVDWDNVDITLTNANPNLNGNKPVIHPWRLYFISPESYGRIDAYSNMYETNQVNETKAKAVVLGAMADSAPETGALLEYPVNDAVTQFKIKAKQNVPSNGKHQGFNIDELTIPATYQYYCAPKIDPSAFLIARVSEFEKYDMLPGEANLFFTNTYIGKVYINPSTVDDTLELSLGRDQSIVVKREKIKAFCETKKISGNTKESIGIEISIRNTKATKIHLIIEDQVPVSSTKDIEVSIDDVGSAIHSKSTGKLRWSKNILAGSSESIQFKYAIKFPSDRKINL